MIDARGGYPTPPASRAFIEWHTASTARVCPKACSRSKTPTQVSNCRSCPARCANAGSPSVGTHHRLLWIHPFMDSNGRVVNPLIEKGLLVSASNGAPLLLGFPIDVVERWFPKLYP
jgi:hypothetical protein